MIVVNLLGYGINNHGLIIQWGKYTQSGTGFTTITLPTAFASTNYSVTLAVGNLGWNSGVPPQTKSYTKTNFQALMNQVSDGHWIAIGY